jgi:hypothetical protein
MGKPAEENRTEFRSRTRPNMYVGSIGLHRNTTRSVTGTQQGSAMMTLHLI